MNETTVVLPEQSGIAQAEDIHQMLDEALLAGQPIVLDAGRVERVDTSALQMLFSFVSTAQSKAIRIRWAEVSDAFTAGADLLGLRARLMEA